ncbi:helix-turn-helix domain-containing protein [Gordonia sp. X0973]|uniref:helix-turn-helix domain-containing protein n=1 Tax=Gordonia sp. X0973 TaxID=2742602 RepID=UPI000F51BF7D|nr:helix-turn-helix domain-containing protein [Gordonia sp. X0973]QKT08032.1 helix-turn-helix domain-containing protein [Gordonia sp. X0973]
MLDDDEVLVAKQAAKILGTTEQALAHDRSRGIGIPYVRVGRRIRYLRSDVVGALEAGRVVPGETKTEVGAA